MAFIWIVEIDGVLGCGVVLWFAIISITARNGVFNWTMETMVEYKDRTLTRMVYVYYALGNVRAENHTNLQGLDDGGWFIL